MQHLPEGAKGPWWQWPGSTGRRIAAWQSSPCSYNEVVCSLGACVRGGGRREHRGIAKKGNVKQRAEVKHS